MRAKRAKANRRDKASKTPSPPASKTNRQSLVFTRKFLLAVILTVVPISLIPEAWFGPLNRITARLAGDVLRVWTLNPVLRGTGINLDGFRVTVIAECSAIHLFALLSAFVYAFPSNRGGKWIGISVGIGLLFLVNVLRIALVTVIGLYFPDRFEAAHVYFGQLGMLVITITICLMWCRWARSPEKRNGPLLFFMRFILFSIIPFLLWVPLNRIYIGGVDAVVQWMFNLASLRLLIQHQHELYYQTFSLIALGGLLMAVRGIRLALRLRLMFLGLTLLTLLQILLRLCNAWINALQIAWITPVSQIAYNLCVYAVPMAVALLVLMQVRLRQEAIPE